MYSTAEAAGFIGCSSSYVKHLCQAGKLDGAQKVGWGWVIPDDTVKSFKLTRKRVKKS